MLNLKPTTRKFYNKWMYKATLLLPGVALYRLHSLEAIPSLTFDTNGYHRHSTLSRASANKENIIKLSILLTSFNKDEWSKRIESNSIDIYTNSKEIFDTVLAEMKDIVRSAYAPVDGNKAILENTTSIIAKKLPHDKYAYKAFLMPHRIKDRQEKEEYIRWIETQGDKILMSSRVKDWFIKTDYNWDRRYLLVEDEATLLMLKLRKSEAIGRVYDYIISDK